MKICVDFTIIKFWFSVQIFSTIRWMFIKIFSYEIPDPIPNWFISNNLSSLMKKVCTEFFQLCWSINSSLEAWWVMVWFFYQFYMLWSILHRFLCFYHSHRQTHQITTFFVISPLFIYIDCCLRRMQLPLFNIVIFFPFFHFFYYLF